MDNDDWESGNCAKYPGSGGNWYNEGNCLNQNLNGVFGADGKEGVKYMFWRAFDPNKYSAIALKTMRWMMREVV